MHVTRRGELLRLKSLWTLGVVGLVVATFGFARFASTAKGAAMIRDGGGELHGVCVLPRWIRGTFGEHASLLFSQVTEIHINNPTISGRDIVRAISCFETSMVDVLDLSSSSVDDDAVVAIVSRCPSLRFIHLGGTRITGRVLSSLASLHRLEELHVEGIELSKGLEEIQRLEGRGVQVRQWALVGDWRRQTQPSWAFVRATWAADAIALHGE